MKHDFLEIQQAFTLKICKHEYESKLKACMLESKQASKQNLFVNTGRVCGSYIADVGLQLYRLCHQS